MANYKLSIIIPCYANTTIVSDNMKRLLSQLCFSAERARTATQIIVIDDCSPCPVPKTNDESYNYADLLYVSLPSNQGVSRARNEGLDLAQGEYVTFIDADDYVVLDYVEGVIDAVDGYDYATFETFTEFGNVIPFRDEFYGNYAVWAWAFRREAIGGVRFDESLNVGEDIDWLKSLHLEDRDGNRETAEPLYIYYWGGNPDSLRKRFNRGEIPQNKEDKNDSV